nr:hypothetical protein CFP56_70529 [Quercus suber]
MFNPQSAGRRRGGIIQWAGVTFDAASRAFCVRQVCCSFVADSASRLLKRLGSCTVMGVHVATARSGFSISVSQENLARTVDLQ